MSTEDIRARHPRGPSYGGFDVCYHCGIEWPCDAAELLAKLDAVEELVTDWHLGQPSKDDEWWIQKLGAILEGE